MLLFKKVLKLKLSSDFNTLVLKIALNMKESSIASSIVSYYSASLDEHMIERALKTD